MNIPKIGSEVRISRRSGGARLRGGVVEGKLISPVKVGRCVDLVGEPLETTEGVRLFNTSRLVDITEEDGALLLTTKSGSIYLLEIIERNGDNKEKSREPTNTGNR